MPLKITKDISSHLIKYVRTVDVTFNPFDNRTKSARELLRQIDSPRFHGCNPKLKVNAIIHSRYDAPRATFAFVDGTDVSYESRDFLVNEMLYDVWRKAMTIDDDFELEGKNVDDM